MSHKMKTAQIVWRIRVSRRSCEPKSAEEEDEDNESNESNGTNGSNSTNVTMFEAFSMQMFIFGLSAGFCWRVVQDSTGARDRYSM